MRRHLPGFLLALATVGLLSISVTGCADLVAKLKNRGADAGDGTAVATTEAEDAGQAAADEPTAEPVATAAALATVETKAAPTAPATARPAATDAGTKADAGAHDASVPKGLIDAAVAAVVDAGASPTDAGRGATFQLPHLFDGGGLRIRLPRDGLRLKTK